MNTKQCTKCGKVKDVTEYSKCNARKDGLQQYCKACNKKDNDLFRKLKPEYWSYETGYFSDKDKWKYIWEWQKADKSIKVYKIILPDGKVYIGSTKTHLGLRLSRHVREYLSFKSGLRPYPIPGLYPYFDEFKDLDSLKHFIKENTYVLEECWGTKKRQVQREQWWIDRYRKEGRELLNVYNPVHKTK